MATANPFERDASVDKPGIVGARWWNRALVTTSSLSTRRASLLGCAIAGGAILLVGGLAAWGIKAAVSDDDDDAREEMRKSLELQRDYGWNFGAVSETVAFNTTYTKAYAREALKTLEADLAPANPSNRPYYVPALFQSPEALPRLTLPDGDTARVRPLAEALRPILTPEMQAAENAGRALARLVADAQVALVIDLDGTQSVAFAAGAANVFDPVFILENWPHPKGVVPAHLTLGAAVYYQPAFAKAKTVRTQLAPPAFILDRNRTKPYSDDATTFDNRYLPSLPSSIVAKRLLYVSATLPEASDLNAAFNILKKAGLEVRALDPLSFVTQAAKPDTAYYGSEATDASFLCDYGWEACDDKKKKGGVPQNTAALAYAPASAPSVPPPSSTSIGLAPVMIAVGTGVLLGAKLNRNGSWNRSSGGWGG
ncbi:MAG: hypothetical protein U0271_26920 [Polyangiaceae bacterium]